MIWSHVAAALLAAVLAFAGGWKTQGWRRDSLDQQRIEAQHEKERMDRQAANVAAGDHEKDKESIRTEFKVITQTVEKIVEKPVYLNVCVDDDGLRALHQAITEDRPAPGESGAALPGSVGAK